MKRPVASASFGDVHQLIVVPMLSKHFFGPRLRPAKKLNMLIGTFFANEYTEHHDGVRGLLSPAVQTPLVVMVINQGLCKVFFKLWVEGQET